MILRTRVFELCDGKYRNLIELAHVMGISVSQIYRVREGKRNINQKFIIGAIRAFPECRFGDLFYIARGDSPGETAVTLASGKGLSAGKTLELGALRNNLA